jgi:hypothetical protein
MPDSVLDRERLLREEIERTLGVFQAEDDGLVSGLRCGGSQARLTLQERLGWIDHSALWCFLKLETEAA